MSTEPPTAPQRESLTAAQPAQAHDFDFWMGEWDGFGPQGRQVGSTA